MAHLSSFCQQSWSLAVTDTPRWCPLQKFPLLLQRPYMQGISGTICVSLVADLFVTHGLMMANLMPLQDLFLEWFSYSFFLWSYKYPHVEVSQNASSAQVSMDPREKLSYHHQQELALQDRYFQNKKLTFLDPKQGIFLPNSVPCFIASCMPHSPARMNLSWV